MRRARINRRRMEGDNLREIAADWVMREEHEPPAPETLAERDAWLAQHPDHVAAYDAARSAMGRVDAVAADPHIIALRQAALASPRQGHPAWRLPAAIAATLLLVAGGLGAQRAGSPSFWPAVLEQMSHPTAAVYRTDVGQRSTVTLPDGSVATLNTDTVLRIAYDGQARAVRLVRGQGLFEVAHGQARPFQVYAGDRVITALGTVFDVRLSGDTVKVALIDGRVKVRPAEAERSGSSRPAPPVLLAPGEMLEARHAAPVQVATADVARETSWRTGFVVFDATPLSEAVAELNRYSRNKLVIEDPAIGGLTISGAFRTGDLNRFAQTVSEIMPVVFERRVSGDLVLSSGPESISPAG